MLENSKAFSSFAAPDLDAIEKFYGEKLGLSVQRNGMGVLTLKFDGGSDVIVYPKPDHEPAVFTVLNFPVEDVEKSVDEMTAAGIKFEQYEYPKTDEKGIARGGGGPTIAWFKDPAGNIVSIMEV